MSLEELTRYVLAEADKALDYSANVDLTWESTNGSFLLRLPVRSKVTPDLSLLVGINPKKLDQTSVGLYFEEKTRIFGLDLNKAHRNPDSRIIEGTHLHRGYTDKDRVSWADPARCPDELWGAVNFFLAESKILEIPIDWQTMPPGVDQLPYQAWNF